MKIKYSWMIVLICLALTLAVVGCGSSSHGVSIRWSEVAVSSASIGAQSIGGPYVGYVPNAITGGSFAAICVNGSGSEVPATWQISAPLMNLDPASGLTPVVSCEPLTYGDCVITAVTASGESASANVRILGNLLLTWNYLERTNPVYFKIRSTGQEQVATRGEADVVMNVSSYPGWSLEFIGGQGVEYPNLSYTALINLVPTNAELINGIATSSVFAFRNAEGEVVTAAIDGYSNAGGIPQSHVSVYFWIQ